jgi:hypothetical protein
MSLLDIDWGEDRYTTLVDNGPSSNRLDVAIIGDGYTADQQDMFNDDVQQIIDEFASVEPMHTYFKHFNFHRINVISKESGTIDPHVDPPATPNTALHTFFSPIAERRLIGPDPWVMFVATKSGAPWDKLLVVVNAPRRGGATLFSMTVGYASRNSSDFPRIMIHEAGHIIAKVIDEYTGELPDIDFAKDWSLPTLLPWPNVDTNAKRPKWWRWLTPDVHLPTPDDFSNRKKVGAFQGAVYEDFGVYRPQFTCLMRRHRSDFCVVCSEQWIRAIYKRSKIADGFWPEFQLPQPPLLMDANKILTFRADLVRHEGIKTTWRTKRLDHLRWRTRKRSDDYTDFRIRLPRSKMLGRPVPTAWAVECNLEDATDRIRTPAIRRLARQTHIWYVIVA